MQLVVALLNQWEGDPPANQLTNVLFQLTQSLSLHGNLCACRVTEVAVALIRGLASMTNRNYFSSSVHPNPYE